jgi:membrane protease YdiL (CAAX protease family)
MLLAALLEDFSVPVALTIGVVVFAVAHYLRPVKRYWTFPGHLGLGFLLCTAFVLTDALWLSMGLHAGGILILMGLRPLIRYNGPSWLVGESIFPYSSVTGITGLLLLSLNLYMHYGGAP